MRNRSERLSNFWGLDIFLSYWVLLPWGFQHHQNARYQIVIAHGQLPGEPPDLRETPPDPDLSSRLAPGEHDRHAVEREF